jgi:RNA polymerase sigma-70 factor (ECF subfamily)
MPSFMTETELSPIHMLPSGLCEDPSRVTAALIKRMAHDDAAALVELHGLWSPVLLGIACRMLGDRRDAEEAVQETFTRIWKGAEDYNPHQAPPYVWAFAMMRAQCIERLRLRPRHFKTEATPGAPVLPSAGPDRTDNPRVMPLDDYRRVRSAMNQLSPEERSCLELAVLLKYTHAEMLKHPETSMGAVKNHLRQALKKVRNLLSCYEL